MKYKIEAIRTSGLNLESKSNLTKPNLLITSKLLVIFITHKIRASDQNGLQIWILHRKIHRIKEKTSFFYMTLKDNNTHILL